MFPLKNLARKGLIKFSSDVCIWRNWENMMEQVPLTQSHKNRTTKNIDSSDFMLIRYITKYMLLIT